MTLTLGSLRAEVLRILGDPEGAGYSTALLVDGVRAALDAILPWASKPKTFTITGDGTTKAFALPADLYELQAIVVNETGEILPRAHLAPGVFRGINTKETNDWLEYPNGYVTFSKAPASGVIYDGYYLGNWTKPDTDDPSETVLEPPDWCELGLALYAASVAFLPSALGAAEIGPFKTRVDSGNPEHNPAQKVVTFLLTLFAQEMNRHPKVVRATK